MTDTNGDTTTDTMTHTMQTEAKNTAENANGTPDGQITIEVNASPAPGLLPTATSELPSAMEGQGIAVVLRDEDVLSRGFRDDITTVVTPAAMLAALGFIFFLTRKAMMRAASASITATKRTEVPGAP
jgi:hypothetical protein